MPEAVRLVIWDLDDTFWQGTLAEGPISSSGDNTPAIVRELVHRGIMNSICSRNDYEQVKGELTAQGIWDYFIFPSVNWEPKGPRIREVVETAQLRPSSVLFIDDNPSNLEEARHFCPDLQVAGPEFISLMLEHPLLTGKPDPELTRLQQYQALQQRRADAAVAGGNVVDFLRQSDIRVDIQYELAGKLDRIIELINRTNQLNFTKRRLPENSVDARAQLATLLQSHEVQAGLLHVTDRYGDHGDAGFYLLHNSGELLQFCFSCRILGMGVETWLYRKLGRPRLAFVGETLSDPVRDSRTIDWISSGPRGSDAGAAGPAPHRFNWVAARGGCDLQALSHYFRIGAPQVIGEFNIGRSGFDARIDHSNFLRYAIEGLAPEAVQEASRIGYRASDFTTGLTRADGEGLIILSFLADVAYALYRHRRLGFALPFAVSGRSDHRADARTATAEQLPDRTSREWMTSALGFLKADYDYLGAVTETHFKDNLRVILQSLPSSATVVLLQGNTRLNDTLTGGTHTSAYALEFNRWLAEVASSRPKTLVVDIRDAIQSESEVSDWTHFDRIVYYRLYELICERVG